MEKKPLKRPLNIILTAPSGCGKTTIANALIERDATLQKSISYTTRPKRPGEIEDVDYYFVDQNRFEHLLNEGKFIEYARVFDHWYGTPKPTQFDTIFAIDYQGARVIEQLPNTIKIFILPPSLAALKERLYKRGQDAPEVIEKRLERAEEEIKDSVHYDYVVVNDDLEKCIADIQNLIELERNLRSEE